MIKENETESSSVRRRTILQAVGTLGTGILVGTELSDANSAPDGQVFRTVTRQSPTDVQFNPQNERNRAPNIESVLFDPLATYDPESESFQPVIAEDWSFSRQSDVLEIRLLDGYRWQTIETGRGTIGGQPIGAVDLVRELSIDAANDVDYWDLVDQVRATGSRTVRIEFREGVNETAMLFEILQRRLDHPPTYFDRNGGTYEAATISPHEGDPPVGSGPFKFDSMGEEHIHLIRSETHPNAERIPIAEFSFETQESASEQWAAVARGSVSGASEAYFPDSFRRGEGATPVDSLEELEAPSDGGWAVLINHRHPLLADRNVRKAIAHIFSSKAAVESLTDTIPTAIAVQTGLSPEKTERYLDGELGRFETYGDTKRAAELLCRAGFVRTWEQWMDPRGGAATFGFLAGANPHADDGESLAPGEPSWFYGARSFVAQLTDFLREDDDAIPSFEAEMVHGFTNIGPNKDTFAFLPARQWGLYHGGHPYHNFRSDLLERETAALGFGPTVEVPSYDDPSGPMETVDIRDKLDALRTATTDDEERTLVRELAWIINETVPYIQGFSRPSTAYIDTSDWVFEDPNVPEPTAQLARTGKLRPRGRGRSATATDESSEPTGTERGGTTGTVSRNRTTTQD